MQPLDLRVLASRCGQLAAHADCLYPPKGQNRQSMVVVDPHGPGADFPRDPFGRAVLLEKTPPARPYAESLAMATASSSSSNFITQTTGPKISSRAMRIRLFAFAKTVGA